MPRRPFPARSALRSLACCLAVVGGVLLARGLRPARAETGLSLRVAVMETEGFSACPLVSEFLPALLRALPPTDRLFPGSDPRSEVLLRDLGADFVVQVAGQRRRFSDPLRSCAERARVAAVFASLALHPPGLPDESLPAASSTPPVRRSLRASLEAAGLCGVSGPDPMLSAGGALRLFLGGPSFGVSTGIQGLAPQDQRVASGVVSVQILPFDLSLRLHTVRSRVELLGELGVLLAALRFAASPDPSMPAAATEFMPAEPVWRFDAGLRVATELRVRTGPYVAPLIGVDGWFWPRPYQLVIDPQGVIAERPWFAVLGRVGLAFRLR